MGRTEHAHSLREGRSGKEEMNQREERLRRDPTCQGPKWLMTAAGHRVLDAQKLGSTSAPSPSPLPPLNLEGRLPGLLPQPSLSEKPLLSPAPTHTRHEASSLPCHVAHQLKNQPSLSISSSSSGSLAQPPLLTPAHRVFAMNFLASLALDGSQKASLGNPPATPPQAGRPGVDYH